MLWTNGYVNGRELSVVIIFIRMNIVSYIVFIPTIRIVFHTCIGAYYDYLIITRLRIRILIFQYSGVVIDVQRLACGERNIVYITITCGSYVVIA